MKYDLPKDLEGQWDIYCYQQLKDKANPIAHYDISVVGESVRKTFDRSALTLVGQVSGEWFHLGTFNFASGSDALVTMTSDTSELPLRADALLLVKSSLD